MAAITPSTVYRSNIGYDTLIVAVLNGQSASDTWTLSAGAPVKYFWAQSNAGSGLQEPDITYNQPTGVFTFTAGTILPGQYMLFVAMST